MPGQLKLDNKLLDGFILINKEPGCTSFDVVKKINYFSKLKAGHCGTLDPFAQGLLIIALGRATRYIEYLLNQSKEYIFDISWGKDTDSHDLTGNIIKESEYIPNKKEIARAMKLFLGKIKQVPPMFSAVKVSGKRAYLYARENKHVTLKSRDVEIYSFELINSSGNISKFKIKCSKGTYIRSIARDLCDSLGCCGHVSYLERTDIASFSLKKALSLVDFEKKYFSGDLIGYLLPIDHVLYFLDSFNVTDILYTRLKSGSKILIKNLPFAKESIIKLKFGKQFFGVAVYDGNILRPKKIFIDSLITQDKY